MVLINKQNTIIKDALPIQKYPDYLIIKLTAIRENNDNYQSQFKLQKCSIYKP